MTPQLRSRQNLVARGYLVATVEGKKEFPNKEFRPCPACHHQPMIRKKTDLWNCFDLLAEHPQKKERIYVQVTDNTHHATRRNKLLGSMEAKLALLAGARILIQSWKKVGGRFQLREEEIVLEDYAQAFAYPDTVAELMEIRRAGETA